MRVAVVVIGDLGRSPRMQYHARALAVNGADVDLIGLRGAALPAALDRDPRITVHTLSAARLRAGGTWSAWAYSGLALLDGVRLGTSLLVTLMRAPRADTILVQNPPALPTLVVASIVARARGARLIIDWHNLGYRMLALRLGETHAAVHVARWIETRAAREADGHLCVSEAFRTFLADSLHLPGACVFRDRAAALFAPIAEGERTRARREICARLGINTEGPTALLVSPTSWTADEDFDLLLSAVDAIEARVITWEAGDASRRFPDLVVLLTGDGDRRASFERRFAERTERRVRIRTQWFSAEDYPRALAAADLGLCFHRSASGFDPPMKVADLFGAGVPTCALDSGPCLAEQVQHGVNGLLFSTAGQLADQLFDLLAAFPSGSIDLDRLRAGARQRARPTWDEAWLAEARPMLLP